jgi:hypothetical protein
MSQNLARGKSMEGGLCRGTREEEALRGLRGLQSGLRSAAMDVRLARNMCLMNRRAMRRWANLHAVGSELPDVPVPAEVERLADADAIGRWTRPAPESAVATYRDIFDALNRV